MNLRALTDTTRGVVAIYSALAIALTWPLTAHLTTHIPAGSNDIWQNLWNFWWWRHAITELGSNPYSTDFLFHPVGTTLALHTHSTFNQIVAFPVNVLLGPAAALNFATLLGFVLSGVAAHLLAYEVCGDRRAAYIAGLIFAFFPHHFEQSLEHLNLSTLQFLPWVALYGLRVVRNGTRRDTLLFGVVFALNALSCWHYGLFTLFILPWLWLAEWSFDSQPIERIKQAAAKIALAAVIVVVVMAPFAASMTSELAGMDRYAKAPVDRGTDIAFLFMPSDHHPLWGPLTRSSYQQHRAYPALGSQAFLGFGALILAGLAVVRSKRDQNIVGWCLVFACALLLSLGANPTLGGATIGIPGPHAVFEHLPLLKSLRVANRFVVIAMLALSVLAALGFSKTLATRGPVRAVLAALVLIECLWLPYPLQPVEFSPLLDEFATGSDGAVLDIPFSQDSTSALNLAYQTRHGRPIAGGYISVGPYGDAAIANQPALFALSGMAPALPARIDVEALRALGFRHVVLHKDRTRQAVVSALQSLPRNASFYERRRFERMPFMPDKTFQQISRMLEAQVGPALAEDERVRIFELAP